jgi:hypothetical protein
MCMPVAGDPHPSPTEESQDVAAIKFPSVLFCGPLVGPRRSRSIVWLAICVGYIPISDKLGRGHRPTLMEAKAPFDSELTLQQREGMNETRPTLGMAVPP